MFELVEIRKNAREYVYFLSNNTINQSEILKDRKEFLSERLITKIETLKDLSNNINSLLVNE